MGKLVRDKIPQIIEASGETPITRILERDEYLACLETKLDEEVREFHESKAPEELADILAASCSATEKALDLFLWGTKGQFFWDGNKRTSLCLANKVLLSAGEKPKLTVHLQPKESGLACAVKLVEELRLKRQESEQPQTNQDNQKGTTL